MNLKRFFMYGIPKSFLLKIIIFLIILLLGKNVFAQDFNVSNTDVSSPNSSGTGKYTGTEIYNSGTNNVYNIGTRYNGQLSRIIFNLASGGYADPDGFEKGHTYTLTLNMATNDWRNKFGSVSVKCEGSSGTELSNGRVNYISYRKINFSFTTPSDRYCQFVYVDLRSSNITSTAFTGVSNWNLSSMVITDPYYCTDCGSSSNPTPTPQPNNQDIINNATQNTNSIINNQNDNTNDIIENNNQNNEIINSSLNATCKNGPLLLITSLIEDNNKYLNSSGQLVSDNNAGVSLFLVVKPDSHYHFNFPGGATGTSYHVCQYGSSKQLLDGGCKSLGALSSSDLITGHFTQYIRITIYKSWWFNMTLQGPVCNNWELEAQNKTNDKLDTANAIAQDTNNYLKDNSDPNISNNELSSFFNGITFTDPLNYLLTLPTQLINTLVSQSNSCQVVNLGTLMDVPITLPCIDIEDYVGSSLWNTIDILFAVGILVGIFSYFYNGIMNALTLGGYIDARRHLGFMTPLEFLADIIGGGFDEKL